VGPSFAANEVTEAVEAVIDAYRELRQPNERFIDTLKRVGHEPFKAAANAVRVTTARAPGSAEV
jgi:sulfite reductase (NADPH) hemoprotein beta-component